MHIKNDEFINGFLRKGKKDGLDRNTLCGMMAQNIASIYKDAHNKWSHAVEKYSNQKFIQKILFNNCSVMCLNMNQK